MNQRVLEIIKYKNLSPSRFADIIGVPRSTISHIISGRNNPSLDLITKISDKFPEINIDWLIKGSGSMVRSQTSLFDESAAAGDNERYVPSATENVTKTGDINENRAASVLHEKAETSEPENYSKKKNREKENDKSSIDEDKLHTGKSFDMKLNGIISKVIIVYDNNTFDIIYPNN